MIYFIRDGNYVKIGYTQDNERLHKRLDSLQCGNPRPLSLIALSRHGGPRTERALHTALSPWWIGGEWFEYGPVMRKIIAKTQEGAMPAELVTYAKLVVARSQAFRKRKYGNIRHPIAQGRRWSKDLTTQG